MAPTHRTKPLEVEAMQWDGTIDQATRIIDWVLTSGGAARLHEAPAARPYTWLLMVDNDHGAVTAYPGSWVVRFDTGDFAALTAAVFAETYEPIL